MTDKKEKRIADYILAGEFVPEHLKEELIRELCEEYKQKRQGLERTSGTVRMAGL